MRWSAAMTVLVAACSATRTPNSGQAHADVPDVTAQADVAGQADVADADGGMPASDVPVAQDVSPADAGLADAAPDAETPDVADAAGADAPNAADAADAGPKSGDGYTISNGCATGVPPANPACATVSCPASQTCVGQGLCVPAAATWLDPTAVSQNAPSLATRPDGGWAIAWFNGSTIAGQMDTWLQVSALGALDLTPPLQLSEDAGKYHRTPSLVTLPDGSWLAIWRVEDPAAGTVAFQGRRVSQDGTHPLGAPFQLNAVPLGDGAGGSNVDGPLAVALRNGNTLVAWPGAPQAGGSLAVHARLLGPTGEPLGPELDTGAVFPGAQTFSPGIAALPQGGSLLVWQADANKTAVVEGRRFDATGAGLTPVLLFSPAAQPYEAMPHALAFEPGDVLVTWKAAPQAGSTGPVDVLARRLPPDLQPAAATKPVPVAHDPSGAYPDQAPMALLPGHRAAIVWHSADVTKGSVFLRRYYADDDVIDCDAVDVAGPLLPDETGPQRHRPSVAAFTDGHLLVAWTATTATGFRVGLRFLPW